MGHFQTGCRTSDKHHSCSCFLQLYMLLYLLTVLASRLLDRWLVFFPYFYFFAVIRLCFFEKIYKNILWEEIPIKQFRVKKC